MLTSRWENIDPKKEGRAARRLYRITPLGVQVAHANLARTCGWTGERRGKSGEDLRGCREPHCRSDLRVARRLTSWCARRLPAEFAENAAREWLAEQSQMEN